VVRALRVLRLLLCLEGHMRDQFWMSFAVAAVLMGLPSSPLRVWANAQSAQSNSPASEIPGENTGVRSSAPPSATILDPLTVQAVLGREVRSVTDENMGRIVDIIVDRSGQVRAAVIDFGGFLGVGSRLALLFSLLMPYSRHLSLSARAITTFYSKLIVPLALVDIVPVGSDQYRVRYSYVASSAGRCNGESVVRTTKLNGMNLKSIKAISDC
jgi:hypothetical protein